jgi:hypothetical protein
MDFFICFKKDEIEDGLVKRGKIRRMEIPK